MIKKETIKKLTKKKEEKMNKTYFWSGLGLILFELLAVLVGVLIYYKVNILPILAYTVGALVFVIFNIAAITLIVKGIK